VVQKFSSVPPQVFQEQVFQENIKKTSEPKSHWNHQLPMCSKPKFA